MINIVKKIVVPIDHSELSKKALETAIALVKHEENIEVNVITVIDNGSIYYYGQADPVREAKASEAKEALQEVDKELAALPNKTHTFILEGNPASTIINFAKDNNADLIIMGSRGLSGLKEMFLGSVSHHVVQKSECPVYIVK